MVLLSDARNCLSTLHLHPGKFPVFFCFSLSGYLFCLLFLSLGQAFCPLREHGYVWGSMAVTARGAPGIKGLVTRDAAAHPTVPRMAPEGNSLALNVHSAKVRPTSD